jgi:hypothetical protein
MLLLLILLVLLFGGGGGYDWYSIGGTRGTLDMGRKVLLTPPSSGTIQKHGWGNRALFRAP